MEATEASLEAREASVEAKEASVEAREASVEATEACGGHRGLEARFSARPPMAKRLGSGKEIELTVHISLQLSSIVGPSALTFQGGGAWRGPVGFWSR